jgi:hypothetical protein
MGLLPHGQASDAHANSANAFAERGSLLTNCTVHFGCVSRDQEALWQRKQRAGLRVGLRVGVDRRAWGQEQRCLFYEGYNASMSTMWAGGRGLDCGCWYVEAVGVVVVPGGGRSWVECVCVCVCVFRRASLLRCRWMDASGVRVGQPTGGTSNKRWLDFAEPTAE